MEGKDEGNQSYVRHRDREKEAKSVKVKNANALFRKPSARFACILGWLLS